MTDLVMGIDPGLKGGICCMSMGGNEIHLVEMPIIKDGSKEVVDAHALSSLFKKLIADGNRIKRVFIEKGQAMPKQGVASTFNYGRHCGHIEMLAVALDLPYMLVHPSLWTKAMHVGCMAETAKGKSILAAQRLFPQVRLIPPGRKVPHLGLVDVLLITEFGRRSFEGNSRKD